MADGAGCPLGSTRYADPVVDDLSFSVRRIPPLSVEWHQLFSAMYGELLADGVYTGAELAAMMDTKAHETSWLPQGHFVWLASFGGFLGPTMVGSVELLLRDDQTAVIEQLGVHPPYRKHGYARQLVREAVAAALTLPTTRSSTWGF